MNVPPITKKAPPKYNVYTPQITKNRVVEWAYAHSERERKRQFWKVYFFLSILPFYGIFFLNRLIFFRPEGNFTRVREQAEEAWKQNKTKQNKTKQKKKKIVIPTPWCPWCVIDLFVCGTQKKLGTKWIQHGGGGSRFGGNYELIFTPNLRPTLSMESLAFGNVFGLVCLHLGRRRIRLQAYNGHKTVKWRPRFMFLVTDNITDHKIHKYSRLLL